MENFKIIGISIETTNQNNQAAVDLGTLWQRFYGEGIPEKIPNKESEDIYTIYTDYESDYTGKYKAIIGQRVSAIDNIPHGLVGRVVENANVKKYIAKGEMPDAVVNTWKEIWTNDATLNRSYIADFEVYGEKSQQGAESEVEIYIGIE